MGKLAMLVNFLCVDCLAPWGVPSRTDGCALRGIPDGNGQGRDWITDCVAQMEIYDCLTAAAEALGN